MARVYGSCPVEHPALQMRKLIVSRSCLRLQQFFQNMLLKQIQLGLVAEEAGLIDSEVFEQLRKFLLPLLADQQTVVAVEGIDAGIPSGGAQAVLQEVRAAFVEVHAAFLVHEGLQQFSSASVNAAC